MKVMFAYYVYEEKVKILDLLSRKNYPKNPTFPMISSSKSKAMIF